MRYVLAILVTLAATSSALAMPWREHPLLSFAATPMAETPDEGPDGTRTAVGYFDRLDREGYRCDARDRPARHIRIFCLGPSRNRLDYEGQFVGAGYLQLNHITVDGIALSREGIIAHQDRVYGDKPPRLEGE